MSDQLVNLIMSRIIDLVPEENAKEIRDRMHITLNDFDVSQKETALTVYEGHIPECYKIYCVTRKIEGMSELSLNRYRLELEKFFNTVNKPLEEIKTNDVRAYLYVRQERDGISNRTLDGVRTILHTFFEWAANEEYVLKNPVRTIKPIKYTSEPREPLSAMEMEMLRNACVTKRDRAMVEFFYSTGCRVSEAVKVDWKDINFEKKEVLLFGKGSKYRISYINAKAEYALKDYFVSCNKAADGAVFSGERKPFNRISKAGIEKRIGQLGELAGIKRKVFPHLIRHTTATDGLNRGMDVTEVQKMLGHASVNTTMVYTHVDEQKTKANHMRCIV